MRCSGTLPCEYCIKEDVPQTCEYDGQRVPPPALAEMTVQDTSNDSIPQGNTARSSTIEYRGARSSAEPRSRSRSPGEQQHHTLFSQPNLFEPPQMFAEDQHVGPTAGISFLYHPWNKGGELPSSRSSQVNPCAVSCSVPLVSYGDFPQSVSEQPQNRLPTDLTQEQIFIALERYFRFATPTYRYMHRPTLEKWALLYIKDDPKLGNAQRACVLLACAQSLLYTVKSNSYITDDYDSIRQSRLGFEKAKELLDRETGPPSLASVQSRLAMCLYMLSTYRMTACRYCFSLTATILTSLGLHRAQSTKSQRVVVDSVESELRKRVFWCAYVLDGYLSVMLGRPRIFRDEDIDQPYPRNVDDNDLMSTEPIDVLPQHGNLEACLAHASLAKLMARNSDRLYPLHALTEEEVLQRSNELLDALESWRQSLPNFLRPGNRTLTGERMFERQNTVVKLAHAHMRILITRRCLLSDTSRLGCLGHLADPQSPPNPQTTRPIQECVAGITTVLDAATTLMERGALFHCFWFTQYITLVAASTLYIFLIQGTRQALPASMDSFLDVGSYFEKAKKCQRHLDSLAPPGSQAKRHYQLLDHLRCRVERDLVKVQREARPSLISPAIVNHRTAQPGDGFPNVDHADADADSDPTGTGTGLPFAHSSPPPHRPQIDFAHMTIPREECNDTTGFAPQLDNSASDMDQSIANMLNLGWVGLDTVGFIIPGDNYDFGEQYQ